MSHRRRALILDLDNTLYDWVGFFVPAINALVETASEILAVDPNALRDDLRLVHRRHENSEHPFALLETAAVRDWLAGRPARVAMEALDPAFHAFNRVRREKLRLYPGVRELLDRLAGQGILVAAFSESRQYGVFDRLSRLGVEDAFDVVFCRPPSPSTELVRSSRSAFLRRLKSDKYRLLPEAFRKPDAAALRGVLLRWGIDPSRSAYVGDSVFKDVLMAREADVPAVWARYGAVVDSDLYADLVSVSHWTDTDIARDKALRAHAGEVRPDFVIDDVRDIWDVLKALDARAPRYAVGV
ncbi:HAD family hydrolase [Salinarimonas sp.]|uniref:HAD family hydrolase n=1 Tax=Salinarimonas sp. TaxID=2766526 RepID=UPI0032D8B828